MRLEMRLGQQPDRPTTHTELASSQVRKGQVLTFGRDLRERALTGGLPTG